MQHAMAFRSMSGGKKLNLTLSPEDEDEEEPEQPEENPVTKKKAAPKVKLEIPEDDEELKAALLQTKKAVLRAREMQQLQARLENLHAEEEEASD
jgi:hypothetical protein